MHQQLWGYKVEEKLYVGVREQKRLNTTGLGYTAIKPHVRMYCAISCTCTICFNIKKLYILPTVAQLIEALPYKPEGRGFDS
jgi:hypothetical protein